MPSSLTSPALILGANNALIAAGPYLAKASLFSTNYTAEITAPGSELEIPVFDTNEATVFDEDSNNYETVDGAVNTCKVKFDQHVKKTYTFTDLDFTKWNLANVWKDSGKAAGVSVGKAILHKLTTAFETGTGAGTIAEFTLKALGGLVGICAKAGVDHTKCVISMNADRFGEALALLPADTYGTAEAIKRGIVEGFLGFKAIMLDTFQTSPVVIIPEDNLVVASRLIPVDSPSAYQEIGTQKDPDSGLILGSRRHGSAAKGNNFWTTECLFGASLVNKKQVIKVTVGA